MSCLVIHLIALIQHHIHSSKLTLPSILFSLQTFQDEVFHSRRRIRGIHFQRRRRRWRQGRSGGLRKRYLPLPTTQVHQVLKITARRNRRRQCSTSLPLHHRPTHLLPLRLLPARHRPHQNLRLHRHRRKSHVLGLRPLGYRLHLPTRHQQRQLVQQLSGLCAQSQ